MSVLGSGTVLGSQEHILFEMWEIVGDGYEHIVVDFVRFYVACDGSSEFAMDYGGNSKKKYCNMDMPRKVTTVYSNFQIDYQLYRYAGHLLEGFIANYYISSADARMNSADYSLHNGMYGLTQWPFGAKIYLHPCLKIKGDTGLPLYITCLYCMIFYGSNTFGIMKRCSRLGLFVLMNVNHSARTGGRIRISFQVSLT